MVLPEGILKEIAKYGSMGKKEWQSESRKVPASLKGDISSVVKRWIDEKPHQRYNGQGLLGFVRVYQNNVRVVLVKFLAAEGELAEPMSFAPLDFTSPPPLEAPDVSALSKKAKKFSVENSSITIQDAPCRNMAIVAGQDELPTVVEILEDMESYVEAMEKLLEEQNGESESSQNLIVDTSDIEDGTSASSPAAFPEQSGLIVSPLEANPDSMDISETSTIVDVNESNSPDSQRYQIEDSNNQEEPMDEETEPASFSDFDDDFILPPPTSFDNLSQSRESPEIGTPIATSTPMKVRPPRSCKTENARSIYLQKDSAETPSMKKQRHKKRVISPTKKSTPAKRTRLQSDSGIVDDLAESDNTSRHDHQDSVVHSIPNSNDFDVDDHSYNQMDNDDIDQLDELIDDIPSYRNSPERRDTVALEDSGIQLSNGNLSDETMKERMEKEDDEFVQKTQKLARRIHEILPESDVTVPFSSILTKLEMKTTKEAALSFSTLLVMTKNLEIQVAQAEPYGEIQITKASISQPQ